MNLPDKTLLYHQGDSADTVALRNVLRYLGMVPDPQAQKSRSEKKNAAFKRAAQVPES